MGNMERSGMSSCDEESIFRTELADIFSETARVHLLHYASRV